MLGCTIRRGFRQIDLDGADPNASTLLSALRSDRFLKLDSMRADLNTQA